MVKMEVIDREIQQEIAKAQERLRQEEEARNERDRRAAQEAGLRYTPPSTPEDKAKEAESEKHGMKPFQPVEQQSEKAASSANTSKKEPTVAQAAPDKGAASKEDGSLASEQSDGVTPTVDKQVPEAQEPTLEEMKEYFEKHGMKPFQPVEQQSEKVASSANTSKKEPTVAQAAPDKGEASKEDGSLFASLQYFESKYDKNFWNVFGKTTLDLFDSLRKSRDLESMVQDFVFAVLEWPLKLALAATEYSEEKQKVLAERRQKAKEAWDNSALKKAGTDATRFAIDIMVRLHTHIEKKHPTFYRHLPKTAGENGVVDIRQCTYRQRRKFYDLCKAEALKDPDIIRFISTTLQREITRADLEKTLSAGENLSFGSLLDVNVKELPKRKKSQEQAEQVEHRSTHHKNRFQVWKKVCHLLQHVRHKDRVQRSVPTQQRDNVRS